MPKRRAVKQSDFYADALQAAELERIESQKRKQNASIIELDSDTESIQTTNTSHSIHNDSDYSAPDSVHSSVLSDSASEYSSADTDEYMSSEHSDVVESDYNTKPRTKRTKSNNKQKLTVTAIKRQSIADKQSSMAQVAAIDHIDNNDTTTATTDADTTTESVDTTNDTTPVKPATKRKRTVKAKSTDTIDTTETKPKRKPRKKKVDVDDNEITDQTDDTPKPKRKIARMHGPDNTKWRAIPDLFNAGVKLAETGMKIGFPCLHTVLCTPAHTFRLKSYTSELFRATVWQNLCCLAEIFRYTAENGMLFFRLGSGMIPFASHPVLDVDWVTEFKDKLADIGQYARDHNLRLSFHPDQFCLINALDEELIERSIWELEWHAQFFDAMNMNDTHKMQIHVGGVYGNKQLALDRWIDVYNNRLSEQIKRRLVIENDDKLFTVADCLYLHKHTGVPILFDNLHHACLHNNEPMLEALQSCLNTWVIERDGVPLTDYSTQDTNKMNKLGAHTETIDDIHFAAYIKATQHLKFDIMLEIKGKERSALVALPIAANIRANVDIDFNDYKPKPVFVFDEETGEMIELHKIDDIKNRKKALGKAEETTKKKAAEKIAREEAEAQGLEFDVDAYRHSVLIANRMKGVEKRRVGRVDDTDYTHLTGERIKTEIDLQSREHKRIEREHAIAQCDLESANVDRSMVTARMERFAASGGSSTAKQKKKVKKDDDMDIAVKTEENAIDDGEAEMHLSTADVDALNGINADIEHTPVKPQPKRRTSAIKAATKLVEPNSDTESHNSSINNSNSENTNIDNTPPTPQIKLTKLKQTKIPRIKDESSSEIQNDNDHITPAKRIRRQSSNAVRA